VPAEERAALLAGHPRAQAAADALEPRVRVGGGGGGGDGDEGDPVERERLLAAASSPFHREEVEEEDEEREGAANAAAPDANEDPAAAWWPTPLPTSPAMLDLLERLHDHPDAGGPLAYPIRFQDAWTLTPSEGAWLNAIDLGRMAPDARGDERVWLPAARTIWHALPREVVRHMLAIYDLYVRSMSRVRAEREALRARLRALEEEAAGGSGGAEAAAATVSTSAQLAAAVEASLRKEDALTFVFEWAAFSTVDKEGPVSRARLVAASWPFFASGPPTLAHLKDIAAADGGGGGQAGF